MSVEGAGPVQSLRFLAVHLCESVQHPRTEVGLHFSCLFFLLRS
jgi:hypothetical protein